ncbi:hypothetical protein Nepgr_008965 [Nepenthes gracilis]|uniref:Phosphatidylinositol transfer protein N-terminal domain-containing protein n=1 Tax=Nepenthes gracilis TaxID=150966 RepID=A0AAD3XJX8_NEPGR|nr:hypothetical protein Nepgr_008965 [Nepenthes gracilis]
MVQIKEFRIVMPMSLEEYEIAQMYMVMKMEQENTTNTEGVEVLESRPIADNAIGNGYHTSKLYRFQSKIPSWITAFAPLDALVLQEEAWNAYPRCKSGFFCPCFKKLVLTVDTIHKADNGRSENVHGLSKEQLASREVEIIDIVSSARDLWSYVVGCCDVDFSKFRSKKTGRGPLLEGWREQCYPVMTAYKLVTVDAPYWGFGKKLEQTLIAGERALFLETHRSCFAWIDEWFGMKLEQLQELEQQNYSMSNKEHERDRPSLREGKEGLERRCSLDSEGSLNQNSQLKTKDCGFALATTDYR